MTVSIIVNGDEVAFDRRPSVEDVVARALADVDGASGGRGIAVAVNSDVVPRSSWATTPVDTGDRVEILAATQGG
ncbi:sulfur carrier protein ThiS [Phytoactinopolyspora halotolerans]|uniref:Sulfur carrier protein ThiS n=1 Tax=Phytoactinopolyspora halotolerans TaxID=1981512 RepID=A0A6L9S0K5_9ACTN|nr:sulfur carrier protein ThiS [Phytoactinopolyspora halotolerans]NED98984.1 sulfur carrier protein ThiS [Phytoactinopolyspora halotolerans]